MTLADPPPRSTRRRAISLLRSEGAGGFYLIGAAALAMLWANSPAAPVYRGLLGAHPTQFVVDEGLMTLFFLAVGLELRREVSEGRLASPSLVAAPIAAALGGMLLPAALFSALNFRDLTAMRAWAVPVATDIAFVLAVLSLLGRRVPSALKVFLVALAIIDDLGAIVVIAIFYSYHLDLVAVGAAVLVWAVMGRLGTRSRRVWPHALGGALLWLLLWRSGVHPTLAGVAIATVLPASVAGRVAAALQPWVAFVILPLFGLANAGLSFGALPPGSWHLPLALGVSGGLIVGKQFGVFCTVTLARWLRWVQLPAGVTLAQLYGGAALCGIGFTMSLFIDDLAFADPVRENVVKLSVLLGSVFSAVYGLVILTLAAPRQR